ncbi:MAG: hypothetical protein IPI67_19810 [Myxococcales bacterium]|nr:hypothetical protein [Myxococcales bacterium]
MSLATLLPSAHASSPSAEAPAAPRHDRALAALPEVPKITLPEPTATDLEDLDAVLARIRSDDATTRESAAPEVLEAKPTWVAAIARRIDTIADKANRDDMRRALDDARGKARTSQRKKMEAEGKRGRVETPDYLSILIAAAQPANKAWQDLVGVVALSRMLATIGTVEAARELINVHSRFGDFLRVDVQLLLSKMGDKAVAALVEARRHKAEKIAKWATRHLDTMGKAIPSEAVQTEDHQVLADVLRAYGRVRDPDAARIVISFANTERAQVREAARQAVAMMGEVAGWQLRDSYEDQLGKKPPRDWTWDRTARELFGELDRQRLAQVYTLFDEGSKARGEGNLEAMRVAYDKVLARNPRFEHKDELADGYFEFARRKLDDDRPAALTALRRAERLTGNAEDKKRIQSLALTLEGEVLAEKGIADQVLFNRALELDPDNGRAKDALARLRRGEVQKKSATGRWGAAIAIAVGALFALLAIALRRGRRDEEPAPEPAEDAPKPDADAGTEETQPDDDPSSSRPDRDNDDSASVAAPKADHAEPANDEPAIPTDADDPTEKPTEAPTPTSAPGDDDPPPSS